MEVQSYVHPTLSHVRLWDVPGGGTVNHPGESYFEDKKLCAFDCLIIVGAGRFTNFDVGLARAARRSGTPMVFVRSKADQDIENRADAMNAEPRDVKAQLRTDIVAKMRLSLPEELRDRAVFVVSARVVAGHRRFPQSDYGLDEEELVLWVMETALSRRG